MSKKLVLVLIVIAIVLVGYYYSHPSRDTMMVQDQVAKTDDVMMGQSSRYLPFTPTVLTEASSSRHVLYFYASWCPTCIPANADFERNVSMLPPDVTVIRVNYNDTDTDAEEKALAAKYGVTYQHTFVQIDKEGKEITKWNGGATKELLSKIK